MDKKIRDGEVEFKDETVINTKDLDYKLIKPLIELEKKSTCSILEQVAADGKIRKMNLYDLDMIVSVGYRVNSKRCYAI